MKLLLAVFAAALYSSAVLMLPFPFPRSPSQVCTIAFLSVEGEISGAVERVHGATSASRVFSACAWVDREDDGMACFRAPCPRKGKSSSSGRDCFYIFYRVGS